MNNLSKSFKDSEGRKETVVASSTDGYNLKLDKNYTLVNRAKTKENKLVEKFKGSMFGADIGVKSKGFSSVAILATVIVLATVVLLYFLWRF